jgi:hypothetical protein
VGVLQGERGGQLVGLEVEAAVVEQSHVLVADFVGQHRELVLKYINDILHLNHSNTLIFWMICVLLYPQHCHKLILIFRNEHEI